MSDEVDVQILKVIGPVVREAMLALTVCKVILSKSLILFFVLSLLL